MRTDSTRGFTVVAGIDFSPASLASVRWICRWLPAETSLVLVHSLVVPEMRGIIADRYPVPDSLLDNARAGAERRLRELRYTLPLMNIQLRVKVGRPADSIADVAREVNADLVVVGKHGENELRGYTGRTADTLVRSAPAPVLMTTIMPPAAPSRILVPLTYSSITPFIIEWVRRIYELTKAHIDVVHVIGSSVLSHVLTMSQVKHGETPDSDDIDEIFLEDRIRWEKALIEAGIPANSVSAEVVFGEVSDSIVAAARYHGAQMIILGSHAGPLRRLLLGSAASAVLRNAEVPVLVVTEPEVQIPAEEDEITDEERDAAAVFVC